MPKQKLHKPSTSTPRTKLNHLLPIQVQTAAEPRLQTSRIQAGSETQSKEHKRTGENQVKRMCQFK